MPTYLMSYPGPDWQIRGGENFRSETHAATNPRQAFKEWLKLCDAITRAGGHILVMRPPTVEPPLTGLVYTANLGQLFGTPDAYTYLLSNMKVPHRQAEAEFTRMFLSEAGLESRTAKHTWEGQADLQLVGGNRYIATWGVRTVRESLDDVRPLLPPGARLLDVEIREPYFHGDTCINPIVAKSGAIVVLVYGGALVNVSLEAVRGFVGSNVDVYPVEQDDALGYACNALAVNGTLLAPVGLSSSLRGHLVRRGFQVEELDLGELFGKGGGGPRCLVNELRGLVVTPSAPDYISLRDELVALANTWPESVPPKASPPPATSAPAAG